MHRLIKKYWKPVYANDNSALIPELWAQEALRVLDANLVAANLVYRDFDEKVAAFGDTVNAHRPASFTMKRKVDTDAVTVQDATSTNVAVLLDQHLHTSFLIRDGEESKSFKSLRDMYLTRAVMSLAQGIDQIVLLQVYEFLANLQGKIGTALTAASLIAVREKFNDLNAPLDGRNLLLTSSQEADLLAVDSLVAADKVGDEGSALRAGSLGTKYGINMFMSQNAPSVAAGSTVTTDMAINLGAGYAIGSTVLVVDGGNTTAVAGEWCTIAGDNTPQLITAVTGGSIVTGITISPGLRSAVVDDAVVTVYNSGAINEAATPGYASGWSKDIVIDGFTVAPKTGQLITTGVAGTYKYGAMPTPTTVLMLLNRALDAALSNDEVVGVGPMGQYGLALHRDAIALVTRPLATPMQGTGAQSAVINFNGLSIRVTITYEGRNQGHLVTVDLLCGVKTLNSSLGVPLVS